MTTTSMDVKQGRRLAGAELYADLKRRIGTLELPPGKRLSESEAAEQYNVSRQPIREAFIRLNEERLVEIRPHHGTFVRRISLADVLRARFVREAVEADIVKLVAELIQPHEVEELQELIRQQRRLVGSEDEEPFVQADEALHRYMTVLARQPGIWDVLDVFRTQFCRVRHLSTPWLPRGRIVDEHEAIVDAIAVRDADAAEAALRSHLSGLIIDLSSVVASNGTLFEPDAGIVLERLSQRHVSCEPASIMALKKFNSRN